MDESVNTFFIIKEAFIPLDKNNRPEKSYLMGLTLLEILVAALIMAIVVTGLTNIFLVGRGYILHSRSRITTGELGRYFLDRLQMDVRQDTWNQSPLDPPPNNLLTVGKYKSTNNPNPLFATYDVVSWLEEPNLDGIVYYPAYKVEDIAGLRKVKLTLTWNEPQPQ